MKIKLNYLLIALVLVFASCNKPESKIIIISTNDMHANIDNFPALATLVEQYRELYPEHVLLVDAGDRWSGNTYVDRAKHRYRPIIELMNELGYNISTLGNHEFDSGVDTLAVRINDSKFITVVANADFTGTSIEGVKPYDFITIGGLKLGFIGFITTDISGYPVGFAENYAGVNFEAAEQTAEKYRSLKDSCDLLIAISHLGFKEDSLLALKEHGIKLILGGHSHTVLESGLKVDSTLITQTGSHLRYAGITTITTDKSGKRTIENRLVMLDTIKPSPKFADMVERIKNNPDMQAVVGQAAEDMDKLALMNFMTDMLREETNADIALYNRGGVRISKLPKGDITLAKIYEIEPFNNRPAITMMTLDEIKELIMNQYNTSGNNRHRIDIAVSGMKYTVLRNETGDITDIKFDIPVKKPLYKVAMPNFMSREYIYSKRGQGVESDEFITELMVRYLEKHNLLKVDNVSRAFGYLENETF